MIGTKKNIQNQDSSYRVCFITSLLLHNLSSLAPQSSSIKVMRKKYSNYKFGLRKA